MRGCAQNAVDADSGTERAEQARKPDELPDNDGARCGRGIAWSMDRDLGNSKLQELLGRVACRAMNSVARQDCNTNQETQLIAESAAKR
jgi:hypothetical protein